MLVVLGLVFFVIYYFVFLFVIKAFNLKTPGREESEIKKLVPGVLKPSKESVQVIIGPHVEFVATELKRILGK